MYIIRKKYNISESMNKDYVLMSITITFEVISLILRSKHASISD